MNLAVIAAIFPGQVLKNIFRFSRELQILEELFFHLF